MNTYQCDQYGITLYVSCKAVKLCWIMTLKLKWLSHPAKVHIDDRYNNNITKPTKNPYLTVSYFIFIFFHSHIRLYPFFYILTWRILKDLSYFAFIESYRFDVTMIHSIHFSYIWRSVYSNCLLYFFWEWKYLWSHYIEWYFVYHWYIVRVKWNE